MGRQNPAFKSPLRHGFPGLGGSAAECRGLFLCRKDIRPTASERCWMRDARREHDPEMALGLLGMHTGAGWGSCWP